MAKGKGANLGPLAQSKKKGGGGDPTVGHPAGNVPPKSNPNPKFGGSEAGVGGAAGDPATMTPKQRRRASHQAAAQAGRDLQSKLPPNDPRRYMNPVKYYRKSRGGNIDSEMAPTRRMGNVMEARSELGFGGPTEGAQGELTSHYREDLAAGAPVDYQEGKRETEEWRPQVNQLQEYAMSHLGEGLTDEEESAIRGRMRDALTSSQAQAADQTSSAMAAQGLTGSGIAGMRAQQLQRQQQQGQADIEREITLQDLARKGELENLAATTGRLSLGEGELSEQGREYDVGAEQKRQAQVEAGMGDVAGLESGQFENLLEYAENARQAKAARKASRQAAKMAEPTGLETAGTIVGSIL